MTALRVLLTNITLGSRTGTEVNIRDFATGLLRRGHTPVVFSPQLGEMSDEIRAATVPVVQNLEDLGALPDIIHGHHALETVMALLRFPGTPALFFCHDWSGWQDEPPRLERIRLYVAVDETNRDRLVLENGIPEARVRVLPNAVDLERFRERVEPLPPRPARALVFSNYLTDQSGLAAVREACRAHGLSLDVVGAGVGARAAAPERILGNYDLVFAKARCALESLAAGAAVVLCDFMGAGPLVTTANFERLRRQNFGRRALDRPITVEQLGAEVARYDAADAREVSRRVRAQCSLSDALDCLERLYREAIADPVPAGDPRAELREVSRLLERWSPRLDYLPVRAERDALRAERESSVAERDALRAERESSVAERNGLRFERDGLTAELERMRGTRTWKWRQRLLRVRPLAALYRAWRGGPGSRPSAS